MNERDFVYWLQGFVELNGALPTQEQWAMIKEHLQLVFTKVTTPRQKGTGNISYCQSLEQIPFLQYTTRTC